jgi:hypothetical protein
VEAECQRPRADAAAVMLVAAAAAGVHLTPQLRPHSNKVLSPWQCHRPWP